MLIKSLGLDPRMMSELSKKMGSVDFEQIQIFIKTLPVLIEQVNRLDKVFMLNAVSNESLEETIKKVYLLSKELEVLPPK